MLPRIIALNENRQFNYLVQQSLVYKCSSQRFVDTSV